MIEHHITRGSHAHTVSGHGHDHRRAYHDVGGRRIAYWACSAADGGPCPDVAPAVIVDDRLCPNGHNGPFRIYGKRKERVCVTCRLQWGRDYRARA